MKANKIIIPLCGSMLILTAILIDGIRGTSAELKVMQAKCDSISDELFHVQTELNRYEIAYKIFIKRNSKAAEQYGNIISDETE